MATSYNIWLRNRLTLIIAFRWWVLHFIVLDCKPQNRTGDRRWSTRCRVSAQMKRGAWRLEVSVSTHIQIISRPCLPQANILVTLSGRAHIADFGLCCEGGFPNYTTSIFLSSTAEAGFPRYWAPELMLGDGQVDFRSMCTPSLVFVMRLIWSVHSLLWY
jgi:hypothetical protein